jgi:hypothetical protein
MAKPRTAALLAKLPSKLRTPLGHALAREGAAAVEAAHAALTAAGLPRGPLEPLTAEMLTPEQRVVAEVLAHRDLVLETHYVPRCAEGRLRMLGLEPPGPLDLLVDFRNDDDPPRVPLWRALFVLREQGKAVETLVGGLKLSILERLAMFVEIERNPYGFDYTVANNFPWGKPRELKDPEVAAWARAIADRLSAALAAGVTEGSGWWCTWGLGKRFREVLFEALIVNRVPLKPEWDLLVPVAFSPYTLVKKILKAMPAERRGPACVRMLDWQMSSGKVACGLTLLELFPSKELTALVIEHMDKVDHMPKRDTVKRLKAIAVKSAIVREALSPAVTAKPSIDLTVTRAWKPTQLKDLTPLQQKQLVVAGKWYDGKSWPAAVRLGLEVPKGRRPETFEGSFAGYLEVRELADASGKAAFTAFLYLVDSGTVFRAGTTEPVASIVQSSLDLVTDPALKEALQVVIQPKLPKKRRSAGA